MNLDDVLNEIGLSDISGQVRKRLINALEHEAGHKGGELLGRAICETIDAVMEGHSANFQVNQSIAAGLGLAEQMAMGLEAAAATVRAYAPLQSAVVKAKVLDGDVRTARQDRNAGTTAVKAALAGVVLEG